ncbi:hypothetical protein ACFIOY_04035 [Bradyrhizobium sp. TZ2]
MSLNDALGAGSQESSANVIVLDDVSPRHMKATAALQTGDAILASRSLTDTSNVDACRNYADVSTVGE